MLSKLKGPHLGMIVPVAVVVILAGSVVTAGTASASRVNRPRHNNAQGIVTSVNGVSTPVGTTCGVASAAGNLTLVGMHKTIVSVDVGTGTTFTDAALTPPTSATFANVCVGGQVKVLGTLSSGALTATAVTIVPAQAQGIVTSVNGVSTPVGTTCGVASTAGIFTLVGMHKTIVSVDVGTGTTFTDAALTSATFANVCVGGQVKVLGTLSAGTLTATAVTIVPAQAQGIVTSVNGVSTPVGTTCGVASAAGNLTLVGMHKTIVSVDVGTGTTFTDAALTSATFANVCVGGQVKVLGTLSSGALTATAVTIVPAQAQGIVTSVNGVSTPVGTTCGVASTAGNLTLVGMHKTIVSVDVGTGTTFTDAALTPPTSATFANVCVGGQVKVLGTLSSGALTATAVTIVPAQAQGIVTSVNGVSTPVGTTCGVASTAGIFTLVGMHKTIVSVDVGTGTTFTDAALTSATFANVCVGGQVKVLGTLSSGTLTATAVTIVPRSRHHSPA